jgi:clathrin heavy chain
MDSSKWVCVRTQTEPQNVVIVDLDNPSAAPTRFVINADSAILNPSEKILALRAGEMLQIFHIDMKRKIKEFKISETVDFWKWISANTIAIVTRGAVYHWSMEGSSDPLKIFDRHAGLAGTQIINYRADSTQKWLLLVGIAQKEGRIAGAMQLYSVEKAVSQVIEGHAGAFANHTLKGASKPSILFAFAFRSATASKLYVLEVGASPDGPQFVKRAADIYYPPETGAGDFPVAMQIDEKNGIVFLVTKFGYVHLFDLATATTIYMNRISAETIFVTAPHSQTNGIVGINRQGQVLSVSVDEANVIPYICNTLGNPQLAIELASRANLPGAEDLFARQFNALFSQGQYVEAAKVAADSPQGMLRTMQTIQRYQSLPVAPNQPSPLLQYFSTLLERGQLNKVETLELVRPVLNQGNKALLEQWLAEDKLGCSEELGDLVKGYDMRMALQIYYRAEVRHKVVAVFAEAGQYDKIVTYCQSVGYSPDWSQLLQNVLATNRAGAQAFAAMLLGAEGGPMIDVTLVIDAFMSRNMVQETTALLLDALKANAPEDGPLQTRLLEINLRSAPQVADAILGNEMFSHYDRLQVAQLCEQAGLYQRALEHYTEIEDIKRVMVNTHAIQPTWLVDYFSRLAVDDSLTCLRALLSANLRQNAALVAEIATRYAEHLDSSKIIEMFEEFESFEGLFVFLQQMVAAGSEDESVHNKFIMAATRAGQFKEVERVVRESSHYTPADIKDFLMEAKLADQLPLIVVCDRFDFIEDLTRYLYKNNMSQYIEAYVQKINPMNTPAVVGALLDVDCNEEYIKSLVLSVRNMAPIDELVAAVEQRNRLKLIIDWLEQRAAEGNQEPALHNALAKICIDDSTKDAAAFLQQNEFYDSKVVGKFAESRDPHLAYIAYKRGQCDLELLEVTTKNGLFKNQARYLVARQSPELWAQALQLDNEYRQSVIDQVVQVALPESENPEEVTSAVKAFMTADLPNQLIELLEKIVIEHSRFANNRNLQNLLILTAVKADHTRVMGYVKRLNDFDAPDIASIAVGSELYEEAFVVYEKFKLFEDAVGVLIEHLNGDGSLQRAYDFAETVNEAAVWSKLARAQLGAGMTVAAIDSYLKASDHEYFDDVIRAAEATGHFDDLIRYLEMCRRNIGTSKHPRVESELIYAFAKTGQLDRLEVFVSSPNCAQIQQVGDRVFAEELYDAAKLLFNNISNYPRLASTMVKLGDYPGAVEAARRAKSTRTWKEVNRACVDAGEFKLAQVCGLHIITHGDELDELIRHYEARGHFDQIIALLDTGLTMENAHVGMFTALAILYSKYREDQLMEHLRLYHGKIHLVKVARVCEQNQQWRELAFLQIKCDDLEAAIDTMIKHSVDAFDHALFKETVGKVKHVDTLYRALRFYLTEHPLRANELLKTVKGHVDHTRVVNIARELGLLPLVKQYLVDVQDVDVPAINDALNELYIDEEDYDALRESIRDYANFDGKALARRIEGHEVLEFRRIAAELYKQNGMWEESLALSKRDNLWQDAMASAADSKNAAVAEELIRFFVAENRPDCFAAALFTCYDLVRADVVLELAWRHKMIDYAMPFLIQMLRDNTQKIDKLMAKSDAADAAAEQSGPNGASSSSAAPPVVVGAAPGMIIAPGMMATSANIPMMPQGSMAMLPPGATLGTVPATFHQSMLPPAGVNSFGVAPQPLQFQAQPQFPQHPSRSFGQM